MALSVERENEPSYLWQRVNDIRCGYELAMDDLADGLIAAENLTSRIYRRVHRTVLKYEQKALKYLVIPPRAATFVIEPVMGAQLAMQGHIDRRILSLWVANKVVSWVPFTCALFPETVTRRLVSRAVHHAAELYWHPQTELPILTNKVVQKAEGAIDRSYELMCFVQAHPRYVVRRLFDKGVDSAVIFGETLLDGVQRVGENLGHDAPREIFIDTSPIWDEGRKLY